MAAITNKADLLRAVQKAAKESELSVREIEARSGVAKSVVHRVREAVDDRVSLESLMALADTLGVAYQFRNRTRKTG